MSETGSGNRLFRRRNRKGKNVTTKKALSSRRSKISHTHSQETLHDITSDWQDLILASSVGDVEGAKILLNEFEELDIDQQDSAGATVLMLASQEGHTEMVRFLLNKGAQVNLQKRNGMSALMLASKRGHTGVVSLLLENGAHVNMQNTNGVSSLMVASEEGHAEVVKMLV